MSRGKAGFIYKEGAKVHNWKKRYMVIEKDLGCMIYYTKDDRKVKKGDIFLKTIKAVKKFDKYKERRFIFGIVTSIGRTYYVQCTDDESVESWVTAIKEAAGLEAPVVSNVSNPSVSPNVTKVDNNTNNNAQITKSPSSNQVNNNNGNNNNGNSGNNGKKIGPEDFTTLKLIGKGGFGRVLLVRKNDNKQVFAMKVLNKSSIAARGEIEHTRTEQQVLASINSPFLAKLHWSFQTEDHLYFIMDFINGGELFFHLSNERCFDEPRARFYSAQIISGIQYLHGKGIIYRDLKPENILLNYLGNVVMTDFGLSKQGLSTTDSRTATFCGTPEYLAPEIIRGEEYTKAIDWWSVGTLIFEMLTGLPPFYADLEENMYHKILTADVEIPAHFSPEVSDLILRLLTKDSTKRLQDPVQIKAHVWFKSIDWNALDNLKVKPPFVPKVKNAEDVGNIDEEFLNEDPNQLDDVYSGKLIHLGQETGHAGKDAFQNFTFAT